MVYNPLTSSADVPAMSLLLLTSLANFQQYIYSTSTESIYLKFPFIIAFRILL